MRVGVNSRTLEGPVTGIHTYTRLLYRTLTQQDTNTSYTFFQATEKSTLGRTITWPLPNTFVARALFDAVLVARLARQEHVDVLHGPANLLPLIKPRGLTYVVTIHDVSFLVYPHHYPFLFRLYYRYMFRQTLQKADAIITVSDHTRQDVLKVSDLDPQNVVTVHSGVDPVFYESSDEPPLQPGRYFLSMSTHPKRKNLVRILRILATTRKLSNHSYVIVGTIPTRQRRELEHEIKRLKLAQRVVLRGFVSTTQLANLYRHADFFIYPSLYEGFGFPPLEAMACHCPVITANTGSLTETTPSATWRFDPTDSHDIVQKIQKLLFLTPDERQSLIESNYAFSKNFTWEKAAAQTRQVFVNAATRTT